VPDANDLDARLSRPAAAAAVDGLGWQYVLAAFQAAVPVPSVSAGVGVIAAAVTAAGVDADGHLRANLRVDRVEFTVQDVAQTGVTDCDVEIVRNVDTALAPLGYGYLPPTGGSHSVQALEIAIDCLDRERIRPFWKAVLGYVDEPGPTSGNALVDPTRQGPCFWFQRMDEPRPQRNRIHFDLTVPHEEAEARIAAALAAGGRLVSDAHARAFWVLADAEGNEMCVCTWQDRDPST
jgi:4a-hydroxytetrahydrobiopterin dehydratase